MPEQYSRSCRVWAAAHAKGFTLMISSGFSVEGKTRLPAKRLPSSTTSFFSTTLGLQTIHGALGGLAVVLPAHLALATVGFGAGYMIVTIGPGGIDAAAALPHSPIKLARVRGFPAGGNPKRE